MTTTAIRHVSNLVVPSTQNTAPVLNFRCLYTHDLRRKAKRWQDGVLRFHTFNKRVMVYDISHNFIGDSHWRETESLQDGDELELDKGVLIQVGEATGSTDQDLTGLFEKRRKQTDSSPPDNSVTINHSTSARAMPAPLSQVRPKTLNAVLGRPKGPLGRAAIPTRSPCEIRNQTSSGGSIIQRHKKRQKVETLSEEKDLTQPEVLDEVDDSFSTRNERIMTPTRPSHKIRKPVTSETQAVKQGTKATPITIDLIEEGSTRKKKPTRSRSSSSKNQEINAPLASPREKDNTEGPLALPKTTSDWQNNEEDSAPMKKLQVAARKPRRKLMYKELLPPAAPGKKSATPNSTATTTARRTTDIDLYSDSDEIFLQSPPPNNSIQPITAQPPKPPQRPIPPPSIFPSNPPTTLAPPPLTLLPTATPQTKRSPLRKSFSDTTPLQGTTATAAAAAATAVPVHDLKPDPWSREAWDLFGFGRPGEGKREGDGMVG